MIAAKPHCLSLSSHLINSDCSFAAWFETLREAVRSDYFEQASLVLLFFNAVLVGAETYYINPDPRESAKDGVMWEIFDGIDLAFCVLFAVELALKIWSEGVHFFIAEGWQLNVFDAVVVVLVSFSQIVRMFYRTVLSDANFDVLRLLRLLRIARLVRVVRIAEEFSRLMTSIRSSLTSLFWVFLLLGSLIYFFSVYFTQMSLSFAATDHPNYPALMHRFGSIHRSGLSLFEAIFGGVSWDEDIQLLIDCVSPITGMVLCAYIGFCYTALLNLITGTFVDKALRAATQAEELQLCSKVANLFFDLESDDNISWEIFESKLSAPGMQDYFQAIDINPSEAENLFHLLDTDNSGSIDIAELVNGLLRLKGSAGALEMALLLREMAHLVDRLEHRLCSRYGAEASGPGFTL
eukprot:TRINITY_DN25173_c0_g3_i1.p1 TRINITY_DN25173_c0_g3~~TRINITY_DN25173_c0_g3_i1.p1  ORF type:complete len:408 (+),score=41.50 TRINITY_DN25173_c0_g3_i1:190-1413(+)